MHALCSQPQLLRRLAALPCARQQVLVPLRSAAVAVRASVESEADPIPAKRKRKSKAKPAEPQEEGSQTSGSEDGAAPALSKPAIALLSMIQEHGYDNICEIMEKRGIKSHHTALKHLLTLLDLGQLDVPTLLKVHDLESGPPVSLTQQIIEQVLPQAKAKAGVSKDQACLSLLSQQQQEAVQAQESRHAGITLMQLDLVKQLQKRNSSQEPDPGTAQEPDPDPQPVVQMAYGTPVLPQAAIAILSMVQDHNYDNLREIITDRGIKGHTVLKHLLTLVDLGELDIPTILKISNLESGPPVGLTQEIIEQAMAQAKGAAGVSKDQAILTLLSQQQREAVQRQEAKHEGITLMQLDLVRQLQKRRAIQEEGAAAAAGSQGTWADQLPLLLKPAERKRLSGYLQGKTLEEIQQAPYSRKQGVTRAAALDTLVAACKAGVKLPLDRVLQDFKLGEGAAGLSVPDVSVAMARILDLLPQGVQGYEFYEATRTKLLEQSDTRHKVEAQEAADPMGRKLTCLQARLVYYLVTAGELDKPAEWEEQERGFAALLDSLH